MPNMDIRLHCSQISIMEIPTNMDPKTSQRKITGANFKQVWCRDFQGFSVSGLFGHNRSSG